MHADGNYYVNDLNYTVKRTVTWLRSIDGTVKKYASGDITSININYSIVKRTAILSAPEEMVKQKYEVCKWEYYRS